jgi:hypothetical protein
VPTPTLVVEDGTGSNPLANSYASLADADAHHDTHLYASTWTAANDATQTVALIWATRLLDEQALWKGDICSDTQSLRWPRQNVYTPDNVLIAGDVIPTWLIYATAELARVLIGADRTAESDKAGVKEVEVGPIRLVVDPLTELPIIPRAVISLIQPYTTGIKGVKRGWVPLIRI